MRVLPEWLHTYRRPDLGPDLIAGLVVATMLVPQAMAYALLAELPVEVGLYAALLPVAVYALLGSSRFLAVGPVAIVSLLVANGIGPLAGGDVTLAVELAVVLALMVGVIQLAMGLLHAGFLVNFLSFPVLSGFTSAAAVVIGASQLKHILGVEVARAERPYQLFTELWRRSSDANSATMAFGLVAIAILVVFPRVVPRILPRLGLGETSIAAWSKSGPIIVVVIGTLTVWLLGDAADIPTVGVTPRGLPTFGIPAVESSYIPALLPTALVISLVGFMESFAVAQALASKRRQRVDADRELVALGLANLGAAGSGGYPVTGGFSRSVVNFQAGARTGLASLTTAVVVGCTLLFLTPLLTHLPKSVLGSIILVAVASLIDFRKLWYVGRFSLTDGASWIATFIGVFVVGIELGVVVGVLSSITLYLWRTSHPHVAIVGRVGTTEHYRNFHHHDVQMQEGVLAIRVDESLYFANARALENQLIDAVSSDPAIRHVLLICSGINFIDATGLMSLESCRAYLEDAGVSLNLAEVKGPVTDRLSRIGFLARLGEGNLFMSTHEAMTWLARGTLIRNEKSGVRAQTQSKAKT